MKSSHLASQPLHISGSHSLPEARHGQSSVEHNFFLDPCTREQEQPFHRITPVIFSGPGNKNVRD